MENKKQLLLFIFAIVAGIVATALISTYITRSITTHTVQLKEEYVEQQNKVTAQIIGESQQRMAELAQEFQRSKTEQQAAVTKQINDLQAKIQKQQTDMAAASSRNAAPSVPQKKQKPSLALKTPPGKRAVTISIQSLAAVGGLLNPGDFVDVIARLAMPDGTVNDKGVKNKKRVTTVLFQGLEVLAVNTNLEEAGMYYDEQQSAPAVKVTLAVEPQEAGLLIFADKNGKLEFALRSTEEAERQMLKTSTWQTLSDYILQNQGADINIPDELKDLPVQQAEESVEELPDVQIIRGGKEL